MAEDVREELKRFGMTNQLLEHDLDRIEGDLGLNLGRGHIRSLQPDEDYYPQIEQRFRAEAALMAPHYEVFYSLEKTIRALVVDTLETAEGRGAPMVDHD